MAILLMFIAIDKAQMLSMLCQAGETQTAVKKKKNGTESLGERRWQKVEHPGRENMAV